MRKLLLIFFSLSTLALSAQELNCRIIINDQQIQTQERRIFREMETAFTQFVNDRKWTDDEFNLDERIECNIVITLDPKQTDPGVGRFGASVQILASRPVFGTDYQTVIFNFADRDWVFEYQVSQPMNFNVQSYTSNITSLLAYYAYTILGMDYDSFSELGGTRFHQTANQIVINAQNSNNNGWTQFNSIRNRYWLNENLMNATFEPLRQAMYQYHIQGLDIFAEQPDEARTSILDGLKKIQTSNRSRPRSIVTISFLDAKSDELTRIFKEGNINEKRQAYDILRSIDPARTEVFKKIID